MCHNLFNLSAVEHLGCFQFGAVIKKAAVNVCEQVLWIWVFISLGVKLLGSLIYVMFTFIRNSCFPKYFFTFPTTVHES